MKAKSAEKELVLALREIRKVATGHPCFDKDAFDSRDVPALCATGGDICDWTMIAILSDEALSTVGEGLKRG